MRNPNFTFGFNLGGCTNPLGDPAKHPRLANELDAFKGRIVRLWLEGPLPHLMPQNFVIPKTWKNRGADVCLVVNFQNAARRCEAFDGPDATAFATAFPPPADTGATYIEWGNEVGFNEYIHSDDAGLRRYAAGLIAAGPILKAKGYKVVAANVLYDIKPYQLLATIGALDPSVVDYVGAHYYMQSAAQAAPRYTDFRYFASTHNLKCMHTEVGLHRNPGDMNGWANEARKLAAMFAASDDAAVWFPFYAGLHGPAGPQGVLTPWNAKDGYLHAEPMYSAVMTGLDNAITLANPAQPA